MKFCAITTLIKEFKSKFKKKKKKHDKAVLLEKIKLNGTVSVLIFNPLTDSYVSHDEFVLINNVLKENDETEKK